MVTFWVAMIRFRHQTHQSQFPEIVLAYEPFFRNCFVTFWSNCMGDAPNECVLSTQVNLFRGFLSHFRPVQQYSSVLFE